MATKHIAAAVKGYRVAKHTTSRPISARAELELERPDADAIRVPSNSCMAISRVAFRKSESGGVETVAVKAGGEIIEDNRVRLQFFEERL